MGSSATSVFAVVLEHESEATPAASPMTVIPTAAVRIHVMARFLQIPWVSSARCPRASAVHPPARARYGSVPPTGAESSGSAPAPLWPSRERTKRQELSPHH